MEHRATICLATELQEIGSSLRVQGRELLGHGATRVHRDLAQKMFMRWLLVIDMPDGYLSGANFREFTYYAL